VDVSIRFRVTATSRHRYSHEQIIICIHSETVCVREKYGPTDTLGDVADVRRVANAVGSMRFKVYKQCEETSGRVR
jgi:hypothetical protein